MTEPTFRLQAFYSHDSEGRRYASHAILQAMVPTMDDAAEIAATLPKALAVKPCGLTRPVGGSYLNGSEVVGLLDSRVNLTSTKVTGERNETGIRRVRRWLKDLTVEFDSQPRIINAYRTLDDFLADLDAPVNA